MQLINNFDQLITTCAFSLAASPVLENIALDKHATDISGGPAYYAVDDDPESTSYTHWKKNLWWSVDLSKQTLVTHVSIQMSSRNKCLLLTSILLHLAVQKHEELFANIW